MEPVAKMSAVPARPAGHRRKVAKNFLLLTLAGMAGRVVGLFSGVYTRRTLEAVGIGQVSWCSSVMWYFALVANPGLETVAKRDVAQDPTQAGRYVSLLLTVQLLLALAGFAFVGCFAALGLRGPQISLLLALQAFGLLLTPLNLTWLLQARERMAPAAFAEVVSQLLMLPALVLTIHNPGHVVRYVLLAYPFRIGTILFIAWYAGREGLVRWQQVRPTLRGAGLLLKEALPLGLSQVAIILYYNFDVVLLGVARGDIAVGLYSTAYHLMLMPMILSGSLLSAYFPVLSRVNGDPSQMRQVSAELFRLLVWIGFPIAALCWATGGGMVRLLYGVEYAASGPFFEWLSPNIGLIFFNIGLSQPFNAWGRQREVFYITSLGALLNVTLNCLLIPRYGVWAAVATTILAELVVMLGSIYWRQRICPIRWLAICLKPLGASVVIGLLARLLARTFPDFWWGALLLGLTVFAVVFWLTERRTAAQLLSQYFRRENSPI